MTEAWESNHWAKRNVSKCTHRDQWQLRRKSVRRNSLHSTQSHGRLGTLIYWESLRNKILKQIIRSMIPLYHRLIEDRLLTRRFLSERLEMWENKISALNFQSRLTIDVWSRRHYRHNQSDHWQSGTSRSGGRRCSIWISRSSSRRSEWNYSPSFLFRIQRTSVLWIRSNRRSNRTTTITTGSSLEQENSKRTVFSRTLGISIYVKLRWEISRRSMMSWPVMKLIRGSRWSSQRGLLSLTSIERLLRHDWIGMTQNGIRSWITNRMRNEIARQYSSSRAWIDFRMTFIANTRLGWVWGRWRVWIDHEFNDKERIWAICLWWLILIILFNLTFIWMI